VNSFESFNGILAVGGGLHRKAAFFQKAANGMPDKHGVVHYEGD
jgi:hypothetical protein